jgi:hypothetical protein
VKSTHRDEFFSTISRSVGIVTVKYNDNESAVKPRCAISRLAIVACNARLVKPQADGVQWMDAMEGKE